MSKEFFQFFILPILTSVLSNVVSEWLIRKMVDKNSDNKN